MDDTYSGTSNNLIGITSDGSNVYGEIEHTEGQQLSYQLVTLQKPRPYFGDGTTETFTPYFQKDTTLENNIFPLNVNELGYEPYPITSMASIQGYLLADFFVPNPSANQPPSSYILANSNLSNPLSPWISPTGDFRIPNNASATNPPTLFSTFIWNTNKTSDLDSCQITLATDIYGQNWQAYGFPLTPATTTSCPIVEEQFNKWVSPSYNIPKFNESGSSGLGKVRQIALTKNGIYLVNQYGDLYVYYEGKTNWLGRWGGANISYITSFNNSSDVVALMKNYDYPVLGQLAAVGIFNRKSQKYSPTIPNFVPLPTPLPTPAQMQLINTSPTSAC